MKTCYVAPEASVLAVAPSDILTKSIGEITSLAEIYVEKAELADRVTWY